MDLDLLIIGIVFVLGPLWIILHYVTSWKKSKGLTAEDEATLGELRTSAEKLEERLKIMERILDDEVPDWRQKRHDAL